MLPVVGVGTGVGVVPTVGVGLGVVFDVGAGVGVLLEVGVGVTLADGIALVFVGRAVVLVGWVWMPGVWLAGVSNL